MPDLGPLPKLTKPQMARLVEICTAKRPSNMIEKPSTSTALVELGLVDLFFDRQPNVSVTIPSLRLTPLGIRILAGLPGDEFDRFRTALSDPDRTTEQHHD